MNIEIDEVSMTNYANQRMKQLVDQKVKDRLAEIQWYKTVDHAIFDVVRQEITKEIVNRVLDSIDRAELVKSISMDLAELLADRLYED